MTVDDTKRMIMYLRTAFPGFCDNTDLSIVVKVWHEAFQDESVHIVNQAVSNFVKSSEFQPTIAGIQKQINMIREAESDTDYWAMLHRAIGNSIYNSAEEFERLPPVCQSFVGSASALRDLAQADIGTINTVVKGQFLKRAEAIKERQNVQKGLPQVVRQAIEESKLKMLSE